ncbi:MAG TPA: type I glutamate--ammonia ligase [Candidatus Cryosericum sp.]|nr:type I glutamate--ammonia ligase [Candidatus Cryosericum sp.]
MKSLTEFLSFADACGASQVDLKFTDLFGGLHHVTVPLSRFDEAFLARGVAFDGSSIPGFASVERSDMLLQPDLSSAFVDPFARVPTVAVFCDILEPHTHQRFALDPRFIAEQAEAMLASRSYADTAWFAPEFEFYVFQSTDFGSSETGAFFTVRSTESGAAPHCEDMGLQGYSIRHGRGYHAERPLDRLADYRSTLVQMLESIGISIRYHHHEGGENGQVELEVMPCTLRAMGDASQTIKYFAKNLALQMGLTATFMPKPLAGQAGTGMHFHQYLTRNGQPTFYEAGAEPYDLSSLAVSYIAGVLSHASALLGITNPSTISYKRLVPGFEAPVRAFFSLGNRTAAVRVPIYADTPEEKRIEFRPPDATTNVYLAMSAMLLAGIDGIERRLDPVPLHLGPYAGDIGQLPHDVIAEIPVLPTSLPEAFAALRQDSGFLTGSGVFPASFVDTFCRYKLQHEEEVLRRLPHPKEFELYFDC